MFITTVAVAVAPWSRSPIGHESDGRAGARGRVDRNEREPAGNVSVSTTSRALEGPAFETVTVNVTLSPAAGCTGVAVFDTDRSATAVTSVTTLAASLPGFGSLVVVAAVAVFVAGPAGKSAGTFAVIVTIALDDWPDASGPGMSPKSHVVVASAVHVPRDDTALVGTSPAGSTSANDTDVAADGPLFVTVIV